MNMLNQIFMSLQGFLLQLTHTTYPHHYSMIHSWQYAWNSKAHS